jgi:hypothetical protein
MRGYVNVPQAKGRKGGMAMTSLKCLIGVKKERNET